MRYGIGEREGEERRCELREGRREERWEGGKDEK